MQTFTAYIRSLSWSYIYIFSVCACIQYNKQQHEQAKHYAVKLYL